MFTPLNAWLLDSKTGLKLALEDLRQHWSEEDPQWEVVAPKGYIFEMMETHSLLGETKKDAIERASCYDLVVCDGSRFCSCKGE